MPVDKFGRMDEVKTSDNGGVSLSYISNNFLRKDGTTTVTGSINMNGNTLTRVSNPVNLQDVATKSYVDDNSGRLIDENGGYLMTRYLNMSFNKIKNLGDPLEPSEAVTKKYVDEAVTKKNADDDNQAFVYEDDGYIASGDISMEGRRINNVGTPIKNKQVANKFYVDSVVETATTGEKALTKNHAGAFLAAGKIIMNGNQITGLPNPIDRDAATNKNYVDNGGAIIKNPDGSFTAVSDVDFQGFTIKNAAAPVEERDLTTKSYVDGKIIAKPKPIITVWAEEKGELKRNNFQFAFGNGLSGPSHSLGGYCLSTTGRIIRGTLVSIPKDDSDSILEITVSSVETGKNIIKKRDELCSCTEFNPPIEVNKCDIINFKN